MDDRSAMPPCAEAWRGARKACDGDGGSDGRADAGRALREGGPGAAEATSGQRGAGRHGAARGGVSGAASGRRSRPVAGGAGRAARRAVLCAESRHRRRPVPECGGNSEAGRGRGWDREREAAKAACTPPSRRAPRDRRVRVPPNGPAFGNTAFWEPGARTGAGGHATRRRRRGIRRASRRAGLRRRGPRPWRGRGRRRASSAAPGGTSPARGGRRP